MGGGDDSDGIVISNNVYSASAVRYIVVVIRKTPYTISNINT